MYTSKYLSIYLCNFRFLSKPSMFLNCQYYFRYSKRFLCVNMLSKTPWWKIHRSNIYPHTSSIIYRKCFHTEDLNDDRYFDSEKSIFVSFLDSRDKQHHHLICPNISLPSDESDALLVEVQDSSTIDEVFEALKNHSGPLSQLQACQTVFSLSHIKNIRGLKFRDFATLSSLNKDFRERIIYDPEFSRVLKVLHENVTSMKDKIPSLMMCLDNLGIELSHELMIILHNHVLSNVSDLDLGSVAKISFILHDKGIKAYSTQIQMLSQIMPFIKKCNSAKDLRLISIFYLNSKKLISPVNASIYQATVQRLLEKEIFDESDTNVIILILKVFSTMFRKNTSLSMKLYNNLVKLLYNEVGTLSPYQLVVLNDIFLRFQEPRALMYRIQEHASRLINDERNLDLKSDLLLCLAHNSSLKMRIQYESLAKERVINSHNYQDIGTLFKVLRSLKTSNLNVYKSFWVKAMESVKLKLSTCEDILGERERLLFDLYGKYMYFHTDIDKYREYKVEETLITLINEELEGPASLLPTMAAHMISFLLAYSKNSCSSQHLYNHLTRISPQLVIHDLVFLTKGFQLGLGNKNCQSKEYLFYQNEIAKILNRCIEKSLMSVSSLREVVSLTTAHVAMHEFSSSSLLDTLSQSHVKYLPELNSRMINMMIKNFQTAAFNCPDVLEKVAEYICENEECVLSVTVFRALYCFYHLGFHPSTASDFFSVCQRILETDCDRMPSYQLVRSCLALCYYKSLSSDLIHYIFSLSFLDQLDEEISHSFSKNVRVALMDLNRSVCLDYPESKIPWFHESYCRDKAESKSSHVITSFHREVYEVLGEILGNLSYITLNKKSPYYYNIDLEFALDLDAKPLQPYERTDMDRKGQSVTRNRKEPYKKIAVMLMKDWSYTANDYLPRGRVLMLRRHLEILGYIVVEVPQRSWYSMAIATKDDKKELLRSLLYKELSSVS